MAAIRSILELMTSPFGSDTMKYCFSKVLPMLFKVSSMRAELQSQNRVDICLIWKNCWSGSLAYKSTLKKQYFIVSEPKREVISSKIDQMAAI